jgi:hypothetical protein
MPKSVGPNSRLRVNGVPFNLTRYEATIETEAIDASGTEDVLVDGITPGAEDTPGRVKGRISLTANLERGVSPMALAGFTGLEGQTIGLIEAYVDGLDFTPDVWRNVFIGRFQKTGAQANQPNQIMLEGTSILFTIA